MGACILQKLNTALLPGVMHHPSLGVMDDTKAWDGGRGLFSCAEERMASVEGKMNNTSEFSGNQF